MKDILDFFDRLEDTIRGHLSRHPFIYAFVAGVGVVLFWRGVWHTADIYPILTGPITLIIGVAILGLTGVLVSTFVGERFILSNLRGKKKLEEKTKKEVEEEIAKIEDIETTLETIKEEMKQIHTDIHPEGEVHNK